MVGLITDHVRFGNAGTTRVASMSVRTPCIVEALWSRVRFLSGPRGTLRAGAVPIGSHKSAWCSASGHVAAPKVVLGIGRDRRLDVPAGIIRGRSPSGDMAGQPGEARAEAKPRLFASPVWWSGQPSTLEGTT